MDRRTFIGRVAGGVLAAPFAAEAQQAGTVPRIGLLSAFSPSDTAGWYDALRRGLRELGWIEGQNLRIEYRYAEGRADRLPALAGELVRLKVDIIVTATTTDGIPAMEATKTIPIVMASAADPVGAGMVESLARPGGNVTGLSQIVPELVGKRLEILKEINPGLSRVAALWNPEGKASAVSWQELQLPADKLGIRLHSLEARSPKDFDGAFADAVRMRVGALAIMPGPLFAGNLRRIADLAVRNRLPAVFHLREFADAGGLVTYGPDRTDMFRRAAAYVDKILKGARPGDLPIERPTRFELVVNLKTAKAIGVTIPQSLLLRADEVIQ